jgi:hypothetical protein
MKLITMMRNTILGLVTAVALAACGSDDSFSSGDGGSGGNGGGTQVGALTISTSTPSIRTDGTINAEISALVRDSNNLLLPGVAVVFSVNNNGALLVTQGTTDSLGVAKATLSTADDPSIRSITVTAQAGTRTATVDVNVTGTTLNLQGPTGLSLNQQGTFTLQLLAGSAPVAGRTVTLSSARSNTLSQPSVTTDSQGQATFTLTITSSGNDTLTAAGLGLSVAKAITINADSLTVVDPVAPTPPATATEVPLGSRVVRVRWVASGQPVVNGTINFSTTRGAANPATALTNSSGEATTTITASNAGMAVVTATTVPVGGAASTIQAQLEFVAQTPSSIDVQPSVFTIGTGQSSTITAVVRDLPGNLVKNKTVTFTLDDVTGGTLSVGSGVTDSQGRAQTIYTASNTTSANQGVRITATVAGVTPKTVALTVARREVFISFGTGNEIAEPNSAQYSKEFVAQVTDSNGNGVPNVALSLRALSRAYWRGHWSLDQLTGWRQVIRAGDAPNGCRDEDANRNGVLDASEDDNGNGRLDAGNIVTVTPSNAVTDPNGFVMVNIFYPQEYALWLEIQLSASATVQGSEYSRTSTFTLPISSDDLSSSGTPPGFVSPFGDVSAPGNCVQATPL